MIEIFLILSPATFTIILNKLPKQILLKKSLKLLNLMANLEFMCSKTSGSSHSEINNEQKFHAFSGKLKKWP